METQKMPGVFNLLKKSIDLYKKNWKQLALIGFIPFIFASTLTLLNKVDSIGPISTLLIGIIGLVFTVIAILISIVSKATTIHAINESIRGNSIDANRTFEWSFKNIGQIFWISIISVLSIIVPSFFLIIPGIIIGIYLAFSMYLFVSEDAKGFDALAKSFYYVRDNWWRVLAVLVGVAVLAMVFYIFIFLISIAIYMIISGSANIFTIENRELVILVPDWIKSIYTVVINLISYVTILPLLTAYSYFVLDYIKSTKPVPVEGELKSSRNWFKGLSIAGAIGAVIIIFTMIIGLIFGATYHALNNARYERNGMMDGRGNMMTKDAWQNNDYQYDYTNTGKK